MCVLVFMHCVQQMALQCATCWQTHHLVIIFKNSIAKTNFGHSFENNLAIIFVNSEIPVNCRFNSRGHIDFKSLPGVCSRRANRAVSGEVGR